MEVSIKSFGTGLAIKTKGIEIDVAKPNGQGRLGDLIITKTGLIWCKGKTTREGGVQVTWKEFVEWMES